MMSMMSNIFVNRLKLATAVVFTAVALFILSACTATESEYKAKDSRNGVYYEIFVRAFHDSDGDGTGDFKGIIEKLDYLNDGDPTTDTDLGIDGIWLMPINESPSYHGYDVVDYYKLNKDYGTMEDFKRLLSEAKKRGIKIIMDLVVNHTSAQHPWFIKSAYDPEGPYRDWYVWADEGQDIGTQSALGGRAWHSKNEGYYTGIFWDQMPDLNFDNPKVQKEIGKIGQFWLEQGVDGFRLDAAKHIFIDTQDQINDSEMKKKNSKMWQQFRKDLDVVNKNAFLVGEVWDGSSAIAPFLDNALDSAFNFDLAGLIISSVRDGSRSEIARYLKGVYEEYDTVAKSQYIDTTFLTNHDQTRVMSSLFENKNKAKMAATMLLTLPGVPFIYYGEEVGMTGSKPDEEIRLPFPWYKSGTGKGQTDWYPDSFYSPTNFENAYENQVKDEDSIFNHYKKMIKFRKKYGALVEGSIAEYPSDNLEVEVYIRSLGDEHLLVVHNVVDKESVIKLSTDETLPAFKDIVLETNSGAEIDGEVLTIPPNTTLILTE